MPAKPAMLASAANVRRMVNFFAIGTYPLNDEFVELHQEYEERAKVDCQ